MKNYTRVSLFVGGGQDYYGPTADRDKKVVEELARSAYEGFGVMGYKVQVITGGTAGIPDDFAKNYKGNVVDIISEEYMSTYKERTSERPRPYWIVGETQLQRRVRMSANPDIAVALFVQGGQCTTHEMRLFHDRGVPIVAFTGSGGASGGKISYKWWIYERPKKMKQRVYDSEDPDENPKNIAMSLLRDLLSNIEFGLRKKDA